MLGKTSRLTGPQAVGIEAGNFRDRKELAGMIVTGVIAMFGKSSEDRGT
jgi:hypothetical protein